MRQAAFRQKNESKLEEPQLAIPSWIHSLLFLFVLANSHFFFCFSWASFFSFFYYQLEQLFFFCETMLVFFCTSPRLEAVVQKTKQTKIFFLHFLINLTNDLRTSYLFIFLCGWKSVFQTEFSRISWKKLEHFLKTHYYYYYK